MKKIIFLLALFLTGNAFSIPVTAESWLVADEDGKIIQSENASEVRAIASITKLMNAMVEHLIFLIIYYHI